ncbi:MAG: hypothetical protein ACR2QF_09165 [Geminicoccaceae bacterium]
MADDVVTLTCDMPDCISMATFQAPNPALRSDRTRLMGFRIEADPEDKTRNIYTCPICSDRIRQEIKIQG